MDRAEAKARMEEIQRIMEQATLWTLLPGTAAVVGGILVLIGCGVSYGMIRSIDFGAMVDIPERSQIIFCVMWFSIGVAGILLHAVLTANAAKKQGLSTSTRSARVATFALTPSIVVAMVLALKFLTRIDLQAEEIQYIVPVWMMLYGTGVYTAGLFSIRPPRVLGLAFITFGIVSLMGLQQYGVITAALSFGLLHIVFGLYILSKQRQGLET